MGSVFYSIHCGWSEPAQNPGVYTWGDGEAKKPRMIWQDANLGLLMNSEPEQIKELCFKKKKK